MNKSHIHGSSYKAAFSGDKEQAALAVALDVRKFEIELYWKRAAYFGFLPERPLRVTSLR